MSRHVRSSVAAICFVAVLCSNLVAQLVTDRVVVIGENVKLVVDGLPVDQVAQGQVFVVHSVQNGWLWIRHRRGGWIESAQVMPLGPGAVDFFNTLIAMSPDRAAPYHSRGNVWGHLGRLENAIADYSAAIRLDPNHVAAHINRGLAQHHREKYDAAISNYDQAIRLESSNAIAYNNRGWTRHAQGEFEKAARDYSEAIRLDANYVTAYSNRAATYREMGEFRKSLADYDRALTLDPYNAVDYDGRAWLRATCREDDVRNGKAAIEDATRACRLVGWNDSQYLETLAAAHAESGEFKKAMKILDRTNRADSSGKTDRRKQLLAVIRAKKPFRDGNE